jgi:hypothetical protein
MLLFEDARSFTVDDVIAFPDHADRNTFWLLPNRVGLVRRGGRPQFLLLKYKPGEVVAGQNGGGFLVFEVDLPLSDETRTAIEAEARVRGAAEPRLAPVSFETGQVQVIALDLKGADGTHAQPGTFGAVTTILGSASPSLNGSNNAAFSLGLSELGATIMQEAFEHGAAPVGVTYDLTYSGLRPALKVSITADLDRVYNHFSASIEGQYLWLKGGIEAALDFLKQSGAIKIEVIDFVGGTADRKTQEDAAISLFKDHLLTEWFTPAFHATTPVSGDKPADDKPADKKPDEKKDDTKKDEAKTEDPKRPAASLSITTPSPDTATKNLTHTPADDGTVETLTVTGDGATVKVDDNDVTVTDGKFTVDVASPGSHDIVVTYPAVETKPPVHKVMFDKSQPAKDNFAAILATYVKDAPSPKDTRFTSNGGAAALRAFIVSLPAPKKVTIKGSASFEDHADQTDNNMTLSQRRAAVAKAIIGDAATVPPPTAVGDTEAKAKNSLDDPAFRFAEVTGNVPVATAVTIVAKITRAATEKKKDPPVIPPVVPPVVKVDVPDVAPKVQLAFKLKFVHQEERKHLTIDYTRSEAVQRHHTPVSLFGLLTADLEKSSQFFLEVDGHDSFFDTVKIQAVTPVEFASIGLASIDAAIEYGTSGDADQRRHFDMRFDSGHRDEAVEFFVNAARETTYNLTTQFHFDDQSGWRGRTSTIDVPARQTSDRTLSLTPFDHAGFLDVEVSPNRMDPQLLNATDVALAFTFPDGTVLDQVLRVTPTSAPQHWRIRTESPDHRTYSFTLTHHLNDGSTQVQGPFTSTANVLPIDDPFRRPLEIDIVPRLDPAARMAFVDLDYTDTANNYVRSERVTLTAGDTAVKHVRLALMDPNLRTYQFRITVLTDTGDRRDAPVTTTDTLVTVF